MDFDPREDADPRDREDFDIYDPRWLDDPRDLDDRERDFDRDLDARDPDPREPFVAALELPHGLERELVQGNRENLYELNGEDSRMLATIGAFRMVAERDLEAVRDPDWEPRNDTLDKRRRQVSEEEEAALLAVASPHLRSMIIAALDTGMRRGEMLALRFSDIDWKRRLVVVRGETTKSRRRRVLPIGTSRLLAVLEWLRLDSTGGHKGEDVQVFSNEAGEPLKTFKKAWQVAVLKAHGVDPHWRKGSYKDLTAEYQQRFREINLHWHDMRHEHASRLVERGVPLAQVRDLLGHASILTTERYDNQRLEALQAAVKRLEGGKTFDVKTEATDNLSAEALSRVRAKAEVSRIFQDPAQQCFAPGEVPAERNARSH